MQTAQHRQQAEVQGVPAEHARKQAEGGRQVAEQERHHGEEKRIDAEHGVPGVISRKFSVREIATKSLLVARNDYIWKNNTFCYTWLHTLREMQLCWTAKPVVSHRIRGHRKRLINRQL